MVSRDPSHSSGSKPGVFRDSGRGISHFGWLDSRHSFSFGDFYDTTRKGHGVIRVLNDDRVAGGGGFGRHPHSDMEIISFVLSGQLEHKDSMGNGDTLSAGDVQYMSAGTGVQHSEYNPSPTHPVRFLQLWIMPDKKGYPPAYEKLPAVLNAAQDSWVPVLRPVDEEGPGIGIRQQAHVNWANLKAGAQLPIRLPKGRGLWLQVVDGEVEADGISLGEGDALAYDGLGYEFFVRAVGESRLIAIDVKFP